MNKYQIRKGKARQEAIDWQLTFAENVYSWGEISYWNNYFYKLGKRYGLLKEFEENGII